MLYLWATLTVATKTFADRLAPQRAGRDPEAGGITLEGVSWAVAVLVLAGIVIGVLTSFVESESAKIISPNG
jgi:hypothetical protein